ncbi:MAG: VCBS repeat-containing protein [Elusimicrobia bacterium]|nr:VCBS repeat-containing protein [Elusimicrobiota bacterium]
MQVLALLLALSCWSYAENTLTPGYVVRSEEGRVFVDFGRTSGIKAGDAITVYKEGDELRHPVTKALLGRLETTLAEGVIAEVHDKYSVANLTQKAPAPIPSAARVRVKTVSIEPVQPAAAAAAPVVPVPPSPAVAPAAREEAADDEEEAPLKARSRKSKWRSSAFDYKAAAMAVADFDGDGVQDLVLADDREVHLYPYPPASTKSKSDFRMPGITPQIMSLEAADLNGNGKAELFVTIFNAGFPRMETTVLELQAGGHWVEVAGLPYIVRSYQGAKGEKFLAVQQLLDNKTFPFSSIMSLEYRDGKYAAGKAAVRFKRVDWIYDFTSVEFADEQGPAPLYHMSTDRLRLDLKKGSWKSSEAFSQTPNRITWAERILQCRPPVFVRYDDQGTPSLYAVRNIAKFGGLAHTFGLYSRAEIHRKLWNGMAFETAWKADVEGFSPAQVMTPGGELVVTVVATTGKSAVYGYEP